MQLGKILKEIDLKIAGSVGKKREGLLEAENIIRKHLSSENAAEIKRSSRDNDGWIPVEERLPTMEEYQKDDGRFILDDGNRRCAGYYDVYTGRFYSYRHITPYRAELYEDNRIIAWRPLPERYHPEPETEKPD